MSFQVHRVSSEQLEIIKNRRAKRNWGILQTEHWYANYHKKTDGICLMCERMSKASGPFAEKEQCPHCDSHEVMGVELAI